MKLPSSVAPALHAAALVTQMALTVIVAALLGSWLDRIFGSSPFLLLISIGLGATSGLLLAWRAFSRAQRTDDP